MRRSVQVMSENDKDWDSPDFIKVYLAVALANMQEPDDSIMDWLNQNGFCNLTVCPECRVDDFTHVEGCKIGDQVDRCAAELERLARAGVFRGGER
jgi:hypothetical protein